MRLIDADALEVKAYEIYVHASPEFKTRMNTLKALIDQAPTIDAVPVVHARWVLEESPYAEHEEAVDGESHPRYVCSNCKGEAGFTCDPDGFAGEQELNDWCSNCGAKMDGGSEG